jgi:hypothetical protein
MTDDRRFFALFFLPEKDVGWSAERLSLAQ